MRTKRNTLAEDTNRSEKADKFYSLRLDRYVFLPMVNVITSGSEGSWLKNIFAQLTVVGEQLSRKSSVPEKLASLPSPRDPAPCTRFPT